MSYSVVSGFIRQNDTYGVRGQRTLATRGTRSRRRENRFFDVQFLASVPLSYYTSFLNMKEADAKRLKRRCDIAGRFVGNTRRKNLTIQKIIEEAELNAKEIVDLFNTLKELRGDIQREHVISDRLVIAHVRRNVAEQFIFHLIVVDENNFVTYCCHYDKQSNNIIIQNEDKATALLVMYNCVY